MDKATKCGYVAILGRPNVGKSTLLNHLLQQKISITSRKPQTTRHNVIGIKTEDEVQIVFVDTPGLHKRQDSAINRYMNRVAGSATADVDVILFVIDRDRWTDEDEAVLERLKPVADKVIVVLNKIDRLDNKDVLMPYMQNLQDQLNPSAIVPISALRQQSLDLLEGEIVDRLPEGAHFFAEDQVTDRSSRFLAAELVREKLVRQLGAELPYQVTVEIEEFRDKEEIIHISALILVEREGQKRITIGDKGARIKSIGQAARVDMETLFDKKVMLRLWVKVKAGWSDDERALRTLGYED